MNPLARFLVERAGWAWLLSILCTLFISVLVSEQARNWREIERQHLLQTETDRRGVELMSLTLNSNLMGAIGLLGMTDADLKREARGDASPGTPKVVDLLENVARSFDAGGLFIVDQKGIIGSAWYSSGKPSTGRSVQFRPYYQMAMQGISNIYAAIGTGSNERILYSAVPVFSGSTNGTDVIGTLVARIETSPVDFLLRDKNDLAVLLSPQGVVFASSREDWIGHLAGKPTPERARAIRDLKQFGNMFENRDPIALPLPVDPGRHTFEGRRFAVTSTKVQWNDPMGDWTLVLAEDLNRSIPAAERFWTAGGVAFLLLLIGTLLRGMLKGQYEQAESTRKLAEHARRQEADVRRKSQLAEMALRLQQSQSIDHLAEVFLRESHAIFGILQGAIYITEAADCPDLRLAASFACTETLPGTLAPGEGLLGQCALEKRLRVVDVMPQGFGVIRSGLGETRPTAVLLAPILRNAQVLGVIEVALLTRPEQTDQEAFQSMADLLAMNIEIVARSLHTEKMLVATATAEKHITEQLALQQAWVDTIPYPVFTKDADARFTGFNRAYEEAFAVKRENLIGKRVLDLDYLPEADRIAYQAEDESVIAGGDQIQREMSIPFADGKVHETLYYVSGFRKPDGSPAGLVGTFIDISRFTHVREARS